MAMSEGLEKVCVRLLLATVEVTETSTKTSSSGRQRRTPGSFVVVGAGAREARKVGKGAELPGPRFSVGSSRQRQLEVH